MAEKRGRTLGANCLTCQLRQCNEWRVLNEEETRLLARHRKSREYRAGESIFRWASRVMVFTASSPAR